MRRIEQPDLHVAERNGEAPQHARRRFVRRDRHVDRRQTDPTPRVAVLVRREAAVRQHEARPVRRRDARAHPRVETVDGRRDRVVHGHGSACEDTRRQHRMDLLAVVPGLDVEGRELRCRAPRGVGKRARPLTEYLVVADPEIRV